MNEYFFPCAKYGTILVFYADSLESAKGQFRDIYGVDPAHQVKKYW